MAKIALDIYDHLDLPGLLHRRVEVWLPPAYQRSPQGRFPVLYMHDGQNIFNTRPAIKPGWQVVQTITDLAEKGRITPPIVVGLGNTRNRLGDYLPQKPFRDEASRAILEKTLSDSRIHIRSHASDLYLRWMTELVKPLIDATYRTLPDPASTALMGSSMGGLISLYGLCEYPQVFGRAGCLSTHWPIAQEPMLDYCRKCLPEAGTHRLYFDHGTAGLDAQYAPWQERVDQIMREKGYRENQDWLSQVFPGDNHHELYWAGRLHIPLTFLFGK
ncbi:MAG: alpha/beta hydrolase-fold protein [Anaerolineaceae bacterium]